MKTSTNRVHVLLDIVGLTAKERETLVAGVTSLAPSSSLYAKDPQIQAVVKGLAADQTTHDSLVTTAAATATQLKSQEAARDDKAGDINKGLALLRDLVENDAVTEADVKSMGLTPRGPAVTPTLLPAPTGIKTTLLKKSGVTRVTAIQTGMLRPCVAEISPEPVGANTFTALEGHGYSRRITGVAPGLYRVRMAALRGSAQSPWCAPVLVEIKASTTVATPSAKTP